VRAEENHKIWDLATKWERRSGASSSYPTTIISKIKQNLDETIRLNHRKKNGRLDFEEEETSS
jgi:hypothetical protein